MNGQGENEIESQTAHSIEDRKTSTTQPSIIRLPVKKVKAGEPVEYQEVDISKELTRQQYEILVQEALQTSEQDAEDYLNRVQARLERVGMRTPSVEVRFKDLYVETSVYADLSRNLPSVIGFYRECVEFVLQKLYILRPDKKKLVILDKVNGVLKPGRATLLLGPPASGKSTLLRALSGSLAHGGLKHEGEITYNGRSFKEFIPLRTAGYVEQSDTHIGELTVRETFDFAARCQGSGTRKQVLEEVRKREKEMGIEPDWSVDALMKAETLEAQKTSVTTEFTIRILGLGICSDTMVGDEMHRGVSGGQKKRVTTGEMIVGPKRVLFMDEISTGLDSSTTFQIVKYLRDVAHTQHSTMLVSLLQPAPESYNLFDDVLLIAEGHIIYHGPVGFAADYFEALGFRCPERKGVADFLQEVTSHKDQEQYWSSPKPYAPISPTQFAELFRQSKIGQDELQELETAFDPQAQAFDDAALVKKPFVLNAVQSYQACWDRELILVKRNIGLYLFRSFNTLFLGIITAFSFFRGRLHPTGITEGNEYFSAIFFSLIMIMFDGVVEIDLTVLRLPGFYKQRDSRFYPSWAFVFPTTVLRLPYSLTVGALWTCIVYYIVGLAPEASRFFYFMLMLFSIHTMGIGMFRAIAGLARDATIAITGGSFFFLVLLMLGGFLLGQAQIPGWWIWFYWGVDPLSYAQKAMALNEFGAPRWRHIYVTAGGESVGDAVLAQRGLPNNGYNRVLGWSVLVFAWIMYNLIFWFCASFFDELGQRTATLPESMQAEIAEEMEAKKHGKHRAGASSRTLNAVHPDATNSGAQNVSGPGAVQMTEVNNRNTSSSFRARNNIYDTSNIVEQDAALGTNSAANSSRVKIDFEEEALDKELKQIKTSDGPASGRGSRRSASRLGVAPVKSQRLSMRSNGHSDTVEKGMVLPFEPLAMTFRHVNYYVPMPEAMDTTDPEKIGPKPAEVDGVTMLQLLQDCSGVFQPGILTALVGSSGAGKTTLMDVLAGRKTSGKSTGDIRIFGHPKEQNSFARVSGYVEQFDIHAPYTTVSEALWISSRLRFDKTVSDETVRLFIQEIEELVELESLRGSLVGTPGKDGLSVEQRKRLTIAVELVANPSIIFMDEPTSGLDARAAAIVMRTVRNTVDTGRTVVCTIHQPSIDIFEAFDDLLLMKIGGHIIYHGPLGVRSVRLVDYFEGLPGVPKLQEGLNPATWMLQISTPGMEKAVGLNFAEAYKQSNTFRGVEEDIDRLEVPKEGSKPLHFDTRYPQPMTKQFMELLKRNFISYSRNQAYNGTRFIFGGTLAILIGSILWQLGDKRSTIQDLSNILGALYLSMLFLAFINSMSVQKIVAYERTVSYRETAAGMYSTLPYALAACIVEIPYILAQNILFCVISYFMVGFEHTAAKFFWYLFVIFLTLFLMTNYGIMAVYATSSVLVASVASSMFFGLWNLYAGFIIPRGQMPVYFKWYAWLNPIYWSLYGIITSQLGDVTTNVDLGPGYAPITVKEYLSETFGYKHSFLPYACVILIGYGVAFAAFAVVALQVFKFQKR